MQKLTCLLASYVINVHKCHESRNKYQKQTTHPISFVMRDVSNRSPDSISSFTHYKSLESEERVHDVLITESFPPALLEKPSHLLINIC